MQRMSEGGKPSSFLISAKNYNKLHKSAKNHKTRKSGTLRKRSKKHTKRYINAAETKEWFQKGESMYWVILLVGTCIGIFISYLCHEWNKYMNEVCDDIDEREEDYE